MNFAKFLRTPCFIGHPAVPASVKLNTNNKKEFIRYRKSVFKRSVF